jgi:isopenicillin-N epimerase
MNQWPIDPKIIFFNHGSFGSCPRPVLEFQRQLRDRMEADPIEFLGRDLEGLLDGARAALAAFVGAKPDDLVFVPNATHGVNTVLRSLQFQPGDELLVTDHEYNACRNALEFAAKRSGARVAVAAVPFPLRESDQIVEAILQRVTPRTRLALMDHVTSPTALVFPIQRIVAELNARGIDTLVDGAHAPGMLPLDLQKLGAAYYTGNCHKWLCAPKGAGFLHVQRGRQQWIHPLSISHGANSPRLDRSRFLIEFGWTGTLDPTACLSIAEAIRFGGSLLAGGWSEVMARNHEMAMIGQKMLCRALNIRPPCPPECIGSMASVPLPDLGPEETLAPPIFLDPVQGQLRARFNIEVPVFPWPAAPKRLLRISAQLYNTAAQLEALATALSQAFNSS